MNSENYAVKIIGCHNGGPGCWAKCGLLAYVDRKTGRLVKVEGDPENPVSKGYVCNYIPASAARWLYHPDQLMFPLKRVGERGENKWQRITWDQALDEIAGKLKEIKEKHGPECVATFEGTYRSDLYWARARFLNAYGCPANVADAGNICTTAQVAMQTQMLGSNTNPDIWLSKCIFIDGRDFAESFPLHWQVIQLRRKRGETLKLIAVDPRLTETVRNSDLWLQLRPATDAALLMAIIRIIMREKLYDAAFIEKWTNLPFLVRMDPPRLLRESDINREGSPDRFVAWDLKNNSPVVWNREAFSYSTGADAVALEGSFNVTLADGSRVECKPAWQMWLDRVDKYTPELAERITWVPRERVIEAAHIWGTHRPAVMARGVAPEQIGRTCSSIEVCRIMMHTLNGSIDVEGGDVLTVPGPHGPNGELFIREQMLQAEEAISQEQKRKQIGCGTHKVQTWTAYDVSNPHYKRRWGIAQPMAGHMMQIPPHALPRQILSQDPYPIKAVISFASNVFLWMPNTKLVHKALKSPNLELHVVLEHWMTPTAQLADYVLPMASKVYERPYCGTMEDFTSLLTVWDQAVPPLGERRTEYDFFRGLALRLGLGEYFPWETLRESMEHRLKPLGLTFEEAAKRRVIFDQFKPRTYEETNPKTSKPLGFGTPSGRAELYSSVYEALGYDPLPFYEEPAESPLSTPMLAKEYPLILTTGGRFRPQFHSENRQLGLGLREMNPYPQCDIHYQTARELSISNGDWVWIETRRGRIKQKARVTANILPGVVNVQHNWWYPELPGEEPWLHGGWISNANVLTSDEPETLDPMIGAWFYRGLLCRAYRADGGPPVPGP